MPHTLTSHVYKCFQLDEKQDSYKCIESKKNDEACDTTIKIGKWNPCSNLKWHIERCHSEAWKRIKLAEEHDSSSRAKKRQLALASQSTITSHFNYQSATVTINKETFIRGILQMVMSGVPLRFFESQGFLILNGEMARKLGVSLSTESIRQYITDAASRVKKV